MILGLAQYVLYSTAVYCAVQYCTLQGATALYFAGGWGRGSHADDVPAAVAGDPHPAVALQAGVPIDLGAGPVRPQRQHRRDCTGRTSRWEGEGSTRSCGAQMESPQTV